MFKALPIAVVLLAAACVSNNSGGASAPSGLALFRVAQCGDCHGTDLAGTERGPSLKGLAKNWQQDTLAAFLGDPQTVISKDARLAALDMSYSEEMPGCPDLSDIQRGALASWLLTR